MRRQFLRALCPCRNRKDREFDTWQQLFRLSVDGFRVERDGSAHAIGTLVAMASSHDELRDLLVTLKPHLDTVMQDPRATRFLLGTWKSHGHNKPGTAQRNYRGLRRNLDPSTPAELAHWVNPRYDLGAKSRIQSTHKGVKRLAKWIAHRRAFEPYARTTDATLEKQA